MKIKQIKQNSKSLSGFMLREWKLIHPEHYGEELDFEYWHTRHLYLEAVEANKLIGGLMGEFYGGVLFIQELIVANGNRGKGVGKTLLKQAEKWAKNYRGHEAYLYTGKNWKEKNFYLKCGYRIAADMPSFYSKVDFVLMRKLLG